ncbi:unnamed protein product, partial [Microthlaspi erraticum]
MNSISQLPDDIICKILSLLSLKEAVQTSVLSTRWRHLSLWLPSLDLNTRDFSDFNTFKSFGDRFFDSARVSCVHELKLSLGRVARNVDDESCFTSWINAAIKRKIQYLHFTGEFNLPWLLFSCETLVSLSLFDVTLDDAVSVVLPCLKTMHLDEIVYRSEATLETLISSCPVLENLEIVLSDADSGLFRVQSRSLKSFTIFRDKFIVLAASPGVVIDAPLLCYLSISDVVSESFTVNNLESSCNLDILLYFGLYAYALEIRGVSSRKSEIRKFLLGISRAGTMKICVHTCKIICRYSELEPLPQFCFMSRLCVPLWSANLRWLEQERLHELLYEEMDEISFSSVPECL